MPVNSDIDDTLIRIYTWIQMRRNKSTEELNNKVRVIYEKKSKRP